MDAQAFIKRELNYISSVEWNRIKKKPLLKSTVEDIAKADDWVMVISEDANDVKYGRLMYSPTLDQFREQTMGEFYGSAIVD
jgi:hypothetical protein